MKKILAFVLIVVLSASLFACKSKEEMELERAREAAAEMEEIVREAQQNYNDLLRDIDRYERAVANLEKAK